VRVWAFNDVEVIPENGTWFQLINSNGTTTINNGTNGLQKLDMVLDNAQRFGIYVLLTLTNNWAPLATDNLTDSITSLENSVQSRGFQNRAAVDPAQNTSRPRNFLSNDYGGIDTYIRQFGGKTHDEFYTNQTFIDTFMNYTATIASRYVNHTAVLSWEIANDPRCNSSIAGAPTCTTLNITKWHKTISDNIRAVDPNHLISSGSQGYLCPDCPKHNPVPTPTPPAQPSPRAVNRRRTVKPLTSKRIIQDRREQWKRTRALLPKSEEEGQGIRVRGRWLSTPTRRQNLPDPNDVQQVGPAFDGSQGVDAADILGNGNIGFGSFQLFPDQNTYFPSDPSLSAFNNTLQAGIDWITLQGELAALYNKPVILIAFGLVTQANAPFFVPFNTTIAPFANLTATATGTSTSSVASPSSTSTAGNPDSTQGFVTDSQQATAYTSWFNAGQSAGVSGLLQYQWSQGNLTAEAGTPISPNSDTAGQSQNADQAGQSPNDGYSPQGVTNSEVQGIIQNAAQPVINV
jgi:mannan endo-1,4-beta-mannosidase